MTTSVRQGTSDTCGGNNLGRPGLTDNFPHKHRAPPPLLPSQQFLGGDNFPGEAGFQKPVISLSGWAELRSANEH